MKLSIGKLVALQWVDSIGCVGGWQRMDEMDSPVPAHVNSVGWIVALDKTAVTLAPHLGFIKGQEGSEQTQGMMTIPLCSVVKKQVLKVSF